MDASVSSKAPVNGSVGNSSSLQFLLQFRFRKDIKIFWLCIKVGFCTYKIMKKRLDKIPQWKVHRNMDLLSQHHRIS